MPETWTLNTGGRIYGPYTLTQLQAFAAEGRLAPHSLIARAGQTEYHPASEDPALSNLFRAPQGAVGIAQPLNSEPPAHRFGRREAEGGTGEMSHYIVMADMKSRSVAGVEEEIFNLGPAYAVMPQMWLLTCNLPINTVRNTLVQKLGKLDMLFVVDATHDKAAWFNFGPEADARIRRMWARGAEARKAS